MKRFSKMRCVFDMLHFKQTMKAAELIDEYIYVYDHGRV